MSLPQGAFWQRLRQQSLDAVPIGTRVDFRAPATLASWQSRGAYSISSTSGTKFDLVVQTEDFGSALLSDCAFHLDHALEHQASLRKVLETSTWVSPAWQVVTFYYWSYFSAMALSRLLGRSVWFITADLARQFNTLAPAGVAALSKGTYEFVCAAHVSAGFREVRLAKRTRRVHEQLWSTTFGTLENIFNTLAKGAMRSDEERLFSAIISSAKILGDDWPSALRNIVNYRPGFAYTAPRYLPSLEALGHLSIKGHTIEDRVSQLEDGNLKMKTDPRIEVNPKVVVRMLVDLTVLINRVAHSLHDEIVDREGMDRRWLNSKRRFELQQGIGVNGANWPC